MIYRPPLTTGEIAEHINAILGARVYTEKAIRAEVDSGSLHAARNARRAYRRSIRITEAEFLRWAATVLAPDDAQSLQARLSAAS